jgi:predicted molibdopterin-dependent oxidoreductase YjgC
MYDYRPWQLKKTETICTHCADGCAIRVESRVTENEIVRVTSDWERGRNLGDLCAKGYYGYHFVNSPERLTTPLVRNGDAFVDEPWIEALDRAARTLSEIKRRYGAGAIGGVISARCTNEEAYLFQKLLRLAVGTPHIDSSARNGHLNTVRALHRVVGHGRMTASYEAIESAQLLLVIGGDLSDTNPIVTLRVKAAVRKHGATLITVGPYLKEIGPISTIVNLSTLPITVRAGAEAVVVQGLVKAVIEEKLVASSVAAQAPAFVARLTDAVQRLSWADIERRTGVAAGVITEAARRLATAERAVILFGTALTRRAGGYDAVLTVADLGLLLDLYAKDGCGVNPLCEESNEMGVVEMGAAPEYLPGLIPSDDRAGRQRLRDLWKEELPVEPGWSLMEMLEQARQGRLKALYLVGEDPLGSLPASARVREALQSLDLLICQDLFLTKSGELAHIVLPAASFAEKDGSVTNHEGVVQRVRRAIEPVGDAMADWEIFSQMARALGYPLEYGSAGEITAEIARVVPAHPAARDPGAGEPPVMAINPSAIQRYRTEGYEVDLDRRYAAAPVSKPVGTAVGEPVGGEAALTLVIGRSLFHSGTLSRHAQELVKLEPAGRLQLNPGEADRLHLQDGDMVRLRGLGLSTTRDTVVPIVRRDRIPPGLCFFPGHFPESGVGDAAQWSIDPTTGVPYCGIGRVVIEKVTPVAVGPAAGSATVGGA